ncbi:MAG: adenosylhomocysteine nucleosidase [Verrucomicrobiota bacterium]
MILVCFAVKEEAGAFKRMAGSRANVLTLLTGMGKANAERAIRGALESRKPGLVLSCGFAGGLRADLASGTVVFAADGQTELESALTNAGARPAKFHCSERVASTVGAKGALRDTTGADAVEMESQIICGICQEQKIPCAIVRVILDTADEDLPLDFNALMTADQRMDYGKLAMALIRAPGKIGGLLRLQKQSREAAEKLAEVLERITFNHG